MKVEQLRNAILDGIPPDHAFARPPMMMGSGGRGANQGFYQGQPPQGHHHQQPPHNLNLRPAGAPPHHMGGMRGGRGRGLLGKQPGQFSIIHTHISSYPSLEVGLMFLCICCILKILKFV